MRALRQLVLCLAAALAAWAQSGTPITKEKFMKAIQVGGGQPDDFVPLIESLGVDFKLTDEEKQQLAGRGVHARILDALAANWRAAESVVSAVAAPAAASQSPVLADDARPSGVDAGPRAGAGKAPAVEVEEEIVAGGPAQMRSTAGAAPGSVPTTRVAPGKALAVIVHKDNPISNIEASVLRRIYTGEQGSWKNGRSIYVINRDPSGPPRRVFYKRILKSEPTRSFMLPGMSMMFRPQQQEPGQTVRGYVSRIPDAIAYVDLSEVNPSVKVLAVNGVFPTEEALANRTYPLVIEE